MCLVGSISVVWLPTSISPITSTMPHDATSNGLGPTTSSNVLGPTVNVATDNTARYELSLCWMVSGEVTRTVPFLSVSTPPSVVVSYLYGLAVAVRVNAGIGEPIRHGMKCTGCHDAHTGGASISTASIGNAASTAASTSPSSGPPPS